ncbi:hypothetical protein L9F63_017487, partial [Diploptera punctata]
HRVERTSIRFVSVSCNFPVIVLATNQKPDKIYVSKCSGISSWVIATSEYLKIFDEIIRYIKLEIINIYYLV